MTAVPPCRRCLGSNFSLRESRHRDGRPRLVRYCLDCSRRSSDAWKAAHRDEYRAIQRRWDRRNRDKATEYTRRWRDKKRKAAEERAEAGKLRAAIYAEG